MMMTLRRQGRRDGAAGQDGTRQRRVWRVRNSGRATSAMRADRMHGLNFLGTTTPMEASKTLMTGRHDDHSLVQACREGQIEAFGILVRRHQDRLYPTIVR